MERIQNRIREIASKNPNEPALTGVDGTEIQYRDFWQMIENLSDQLKNTGLKEENTIVTFIPDALLTTVVLLSVVNTGICVPLNPAFSTAELCQLLERIRPDALILDKNIDDEQFEKLVKELCLVVVKVQLTSVSYPLAVEIEHAYFGKGRKKSPPTGLAFILLTSATTGKSRLVPLKHVQILAMLNSMQKIFPEADRGRALIMIPHFHLQCILSFLTQFLTGGAIIQAHGFNKTDFLRILTHLKPTQFAANPTILEAVASLDEYRSGQNFKGLRFITSSGSALPAHLKDRIEAMFEVRVFEGYGLTETGRITMTPRSKKDDRSGSVGICYGPQVKIIDEDGNDLPKGMEGEIIVQGPTVITEYYDDPEASTKMFHDGWFKTGDLGWLDPDGYLYLTGRKKEIINRGGEKIIPGEVESVILQHKNVKQAVVFPYPHKRLGEGVAAGIVLKSPLSSVELRKFLSGKMAHYKIPRLIFFVDKIPVGATGKPQRYLLAEQLLSQNAFRKTQTAPERGFSKTEQKIAAIWKRLLRIYEVDLNDDFFLLGGDSILATEMVAMIKDEFQCALSLNELTASSTLSHIAAKIDHLVTNELKTENSDLAFEVKSATSKSTKPRFFLIPLNKGNLMIYRNFIRETEQDQTIHALELELAFNNNITYRQIEKASTKYAEQIRKLKYDGSFVLLGFSFAGIVALEVARQFFLRNGHISKVILFDSYPFNRMPAFSLTSLYEFFLDHLNKMRNLKPKGKIQYIIQFLRQKKKSKSQFLSRSTGKNKKAKTAITDRENDPLIVVKNFQQCSAQIPVLLFWCSNDLNRRTRKKMLTIWSTYIPGIRIHHVPYTHHTIMQNADYKIINREIDNFLNENTSYT